MEENKENLDNNSNIAYIYSSRLTNDLNKITQIKGRSELVHSLINAYDLFKSDSLKIVNPFKADEKSLKLFHSQEYLNTLKKLSACEHEDDLLEDNEEEEEEYGIGYDCPFIENIFEYCSNIGGSSLTAAHLINNGTFRYVCNFYGGWHHAKREKAGGFCYVNDIALCISKLRQKFNRVLYIDLDQHHGDGVQDAFEYTDKVMTFDIHKYMPGFYPGTGSLDECGKGNGKYYTVNVPLSSGVNDEMFYELFSKIFNKIIERFRPEVIVTQCGADCLYGDPIDLKNQFNVTTNGFLECIKLIIAKQIPTVFLGGGGYNFANTSRLWCGILGLLIKKKLAKDIPEHEDFLTYGPEYELNTTPGLIKNNNSQIYANNIMNKVMENLNNVNIDN